MDNKNVFVAIALSMSVLLFWGAFFETPRKPADQKNNQKVKYYLCKRKYNLIYMTALKCNPILLDYNLMTLILLLYKYLSSLKKTPLHRPYHGSALYPLV